MQVVSANKIQIEEIKEEIAEQTIVLNRKSHDSVISEVDGYRDSEKVTNTPPAAKRTKNESPVRDSTLQKSDNLIERITYETQEEEQAQLTKKGRGRPKGSKNRTKDGMPYKMSKRKNLHRERSEFSWANILTLAILNAPGEAASQNTLHQFIQYHFPSNAPPPTEAGKTETWKNTVRHCLNNEKHGFMTKGKEQYNSSVMWMINPERKQELKADCLAKADEFQDEVEALKLRHPERLQAILNGKAGIPTNLEIYEFHGNTFKVKETLGNKKNKVLQASPVVYIPYQLSLNPLSYPHLINPIYSNHTQYPYQLWNHAYPHPIYHNFNHDRI